MNVGDKVILPDSCRYAVADILSKNIPQIRGTSDYGALPKYILKSQIHPTMWEISAIITNFNVQLIVHTDNIKPIKKEEVLLD